MVIAHNMMAMNAQRQFNIIGNSKKKSTEKLSSGYRVNKSADGAAELAISEKMRRQIRGLNQGASNVMDGISLLQVADGALSEVHDMLNRVTELSVKSANGTNTIEDREAIQQEINQIMSEINRISEATTFNERPLFQGATGTTVIPAVYDPSTVTNFKVTGIPADNSLGKVSITANDSGITIGDTSYSWSQFVDGKGHSLSDSTIVAGTYTITHNDMNFSVDVTDNGSVSDAAHLLNGASYTTKITSSVPQKMSDIFFTTHDLRYNQFIGYRRISDSHFSLSDNTLIMHSGLLDIDGNEVISTCDLENDTTITTPSGIGVNRPDNGLNTFIRSGSTVYFNSLDLAVKVKDDVSLGQVVSAVVKSKLSSDDYVGNGSIFLYTEHFFEQMIVDKARFDSSMDLLDSAGIDYFDVVNGLTFHKTNIDGKDAFVSEVGSLILVRDDTDTNRFDGPYGDSMYFTGISDTVTLNWYDNNKYAWYTREPNKVTFSNDTIATKIVTGLDKYADSGYKGILISPEQKLHSDDDLSLWIQSGSEVGDGMYITIGIMDTDELGINLLDVTTVDGANSAIDAVKTASKMVSSLRSNIGAQQNRLEHTYKNITNIAENTQAAESRIRDTDISKEMVTLSINNILEQAGQAMISQANQTNQTVLSLLQ